MQGDDNRYNHNVISPLLHVKYLSNMQNNYSQNGIKFSSPSDFLIFPINFSPVITTRLYR